MKLNEPWRRQKKKQFQIIYYAVENVENLVRWKASAKIFYSPSYVALT